MNIDELAEKLARDKYSRTGIPFPYERLNVDVIRTHYLEPSKRDIEFILALLKEEGVLVDDTTRATKS